MDTFYYAVGILITWVIILLALAGLCFIGWMGITRIFKSIKIKRDE